MWQPDPDYKDLRAALESMSSALTTAHERLTETPAAIDTRAGAIRLLRNIDYALGGLVLDPGACSAVQAAANLAADWTASFDAATAPLAGAIAELTTAVASLAHFETIRADLDAEERRLQTRLRDLEHLKALSARLPQAIEQRQELEQQARELEREQAPALATIEAAMTAMGELLERVTADVGARNEQGFEHLLDEKQRWLHTQRTSETEQADLRDQISALTARNDELRASIRAELDTFNAVTEEQAVLVSDLTIHLAINKELNDALQHFGIDDGVLGLDAVIRRLGDELADLDAGLHAVLKHRQEALSGP